MSYYLAIDSPLGTLGLYSCGQTLTKLVINPQDKSPIAHELPIFVATRRQLTEYFAHQRTSFTLPLTLAGTKFQQNVWSGLLNIPYGQTTSYGALAASINKPQAARAVGLANSKNPLPIIVPCHRVISKAGHLIGFSAGGIGIQAWLLAHETRCFIEF